MQETGLLPHINAGVMSQQDVIRLAWVAWTACTHRDLLQTHK